MHDDLIQFATVREIEYIEAIKKHGSERKAAAALNVSRGSISGALGCLKHRAAKRLGSEHEYHTKPIPDGFAITGVSQYSDGKWIKTSVDKSRQLELLKAAMAGMCEEINPLPAKSFCGESQDHLCNVITLTDCHVGMLASTTETLSGNWDLKIAEETLVGCFAQAVKASPSAKTCIIAQLGDYLHYSSALSAVTELHGHHLSADGRMFKMVRVAIRILRSIIEIALAKHEKVVLLIAEGNHDISSSIWLRAMFQALYENEPRIKIIDSELPYYIYQHGETMLGWHHGHLAKNDALPQLFAAQFPKVWGNTTKRYVHCGHRHHTHIKEHSGITVEQHPTLAARDDYAARGGWIAERHINAITYSDKYGQISRTIITPEMIDD